MEHTRESYIKSFYQLDETYHCWSLAGHPYQFEAGAHYNGNYLIDSDQVLWFEIERPNGDIYQTEDLPTICIDQRGLPYNLIDLTAA